jgi:hypothetical protein
MLYLNSFPPEKSCSDLMDASKKINKACTSPATFRTTVFQKMMDSLLKIDR